MTELLEWMIVVGLAVAITGIFLLSGQIERHKRQMLELVLQSNAMIMAQLERAEELSLQASDGMLGVVLDRWQGECGSGQPRLFMARVPERGTSLEPRPEPSISA